MKYRSEIDGLRTLAVLPVILFHAGIQAFSGGFVGVDVFFVISGYLITTIIIAELDQGTFTLVGFYERRARRILPALFVVMLVTLPFAFQWMLPADLKDFARSVIAVTVFASNILFWRESGYFVTEAELKPLLHTWSLAVEEQYYLLFPLFLMLAWRLGRTWLARILIVVGLVSLAGAQWGAYHKPLATFFTLPTRGWELLIGAFTAFHLFPRAGLVRQRQELWLRQFASVLGVLLIFYSIFAFDRNTPFPGLYALVPTVGTALLILFANPDTFVGRLLSTPFFVGIGLISYSAYLWHQPLFALARHRSLNEPTKPFLLGLSVLTIILAYLSWKYVEKPFRDRKRFGRTQIFGSAFAGSFVVLACGFVGYSREGLPGRFSATLQPYLFPERTAEPTRCKLSYVEGRQKIQRCYFGDTSATRSVALYGDSHAQALFTALDEALKKRHVRGVRVYVEGCGVIPGVVLDDAHWRTAAPVTECLSNYRSLLGYLGEQMSGVVIGVRWTMAVYPVKGAVEELAYDNGEGGVEHLTPRDYMTMDSLGRFSRDGAGKRRAINLLLQSMNSLNKPIFVVFPFPEVGWDVPKYNFRSYIGRGVVPETISTSHPRFKSRNQFITDALATASGYANVYPIKPETILCDSYVRARCVAQFDRVPFYFDSNHLSNAGARLVVAEVMKRFE